MTILMESPAKNVGGNIMLDIDNITEFEWMFDKDKAKEQLRNRMEELEYLRYFYVAAELRPGIVDIINCGYYKEIPEKYRVDNDEWIS